MSRFLMIDIGAGTMDILWYDDRRDEHFKAVAPSPVRQVARRIEQTQGPLVVSGVEMGGGPVTAALQQRAAQAEVVISHDAAATLHHDLEKVRQWGLKPVDNAVIERLRNNPKYTQVVLGDIQPRQIHQILEGLGLPMEVEVVVVCGQDHGLAPQGVSHLDFRHRLYQQMLDPRPCPATLLFPGDQVPAAFNRLRCMARDARPLGPEVFVMDSGMAAMCGASQDLQALGRAPIVVLDVATSHTVIAALEGDQVAGFVEYHTKDISLARIETLIEELADGRVRHEQILAEGGHGAYLRKAVGFKNLQAIIATGPKRRLMAKSKLPIIWGAPWGDNMMTGTVGLLEAVRQRKGLEAIQYL
ncbi:MAG: DUF1786 family protein [Desulfobacteraceae bacterium]|nr:DUF1786 family protein [Desulfobacteraceae bacterium]